MTVVGTHQQHSSLITFSNLHHVETVLVLHSKPKNHLRFHRSSQGPLTTLATTTIYSSMAIQRHRRSGNYQPGQWGVDSPHLLQSKYDTATAARSTYSRSSSTLRIEELKRHVKGLLEKRDDEMDMAERLEMIDAVQRLGLARHFEREIEAALEEIAAASSPHSAESLHACALRFRLLRQAGIPVSPDVFNRFKDANDKFKGEIVVVEDVKGLLEMYEASYLGFTGEDVMEEIKAFALKHLTEMAKDATVDSSLVIKQLNHTLELPLHWRMQRADTSWYIQLYQDAQRHHISPLLELAKLDFNLVQRRHQTELEDLTSWWEGLGLIEELEFARDAVVESFLWAIGMTSHPHMADCRIAMAKIALLVHVVDDVYDVYGYIDELELFTTAIIRWDINELDKLPRYMQLCFLAVYNTANEMSYANLKQQGFNSLPYIKKAWADLCGSYLEEARAYHSGVNLKLEQYLNIAWKSVACSIVLIHGYLSSPTEILKHEVVHLLSEVDPNLTRLTSIIVRLTNDLASSKGERERGDVMKAVECCMRDKRLTEEAARDLIDKMIDKTWKMINEDISSSRRSLNDSNYLMLPPTYVKLAVNVARASHYMYKHGKSKASSYDVKDKDAAVALLFDTL